MLETGHLARSLDQKIIQCMDNGTEEIADSLDFVISDRSKDDLVVQKAIV